MESGFLDSTLQSINSVQTQIADAESRLADVLAAAKQELVALYDQKRALEAEARRALGEIAPIRRIPAELLRAVFLQVFKDDSSGRAGWLVSAVCRRWRELALATPRLWTRIRLITKLDDNVDVIRLWLERAGPSMLLDIEIYLRVAQAKAAIPAECASTIQTPVANRRVRRRMGTSLDDPGHSAPIGNGSESWGHIAIFYLKQQMPRWKRFIFRYDRVFSSLSAFKGIIGDAPRLEEFEISSIEPSLLNFNDWLWIPNSTTTTALPALRKVSLTNVNSIYTLSSALLSQPLRDIHISALATLPMQVTTLMQALAKHAPTLHTLSLNLPSITPPVVPVNAFPYSTNSPLSFPLLEELSLGGHSLLSHFASTIATPSLEELNVDIDLGRGGVIHGLAPGGPGTANNFSYIEDIVNNLLHRGSPAPADKLKALSIAFGFGNGRRATRERDAQPYLRALKSAQACACPGTTFLPPGHPSTPGTPSPSVVHLSWQFLGSLPALESLKVGLGGQAGPAWTANGNTGVNVVHYQGGASDLHHFLNSLCTPDEDFVSGAASIGMTAPNGTGISFTLGFQPLANGNNTLPAFNIPPPPPPIGVNQAATFGLPPPPMPAFFAPPPAGFFGGLPPGGVFYHAHNNNNNNNTTTTTTNGWLLPNLTELGIKVGSATFLPVSNNGGTPGLFPSSSLSNSYLGHSSILYSNAWSPPIDDLGAPSVGYVRRLFDLIESRNPKTGRGPSIDGVIPERLKSLELVLNVAGVPARGVGHAASLLTKQERGEKKTKGKKKANVKKAEVEEIPNPTPTGNNIEDIIAAISASASGSLVTATAQAGKDLKGSQISNAMTARGLIGADSVSWMEDRIEQVGVRCECILSDANGPGLGRIL